MSGPLEQIFGVRELRRSAWLAYLVAVASTTAVALVRLALFGVLGDVTRSVPFVIPVILAAAIGGLRPGIFATALAGATSVYLFGNPPFTFHMDAEEAAGLGVFLIVGAIVSWLCERLHLVMRRLESEQERLKQAEEALRQADRRKDEFLAMLGHELRNPLAPIGNAVEILRRRGPPELDGPRGVIERQTRQIGRLVDDIFEVSRIARGQLSLRKERTDIATAVESAVESVRSLMESSGLELTVALDEESILLDADPARLSQVITNLLHNAAKYTEKGGQIRLTVGRSGGDVRIRVRDSGIGIAREHLGSLFESFYQAAAGERRAGGLGLGLSIVRGIVELHGGNVEARSDGLGCGSEFEVRLPSAPLEGGAAPRR